MERVLMLRLHTHGCSAEVLLNDIPVARSDTRCPAICMPVHEFLLVGSNEITLVIDPHVPCSPGKTTPRVADGVLGASVRLLLPRIGHLGNEMHARTLGELDWSVPDGDVFRVPHRVSVSASLPIKFPRWRWMDAPQISDVENIKAVAATYLQDIAVSLSRGDVEPFMNASRLRLEELALAYQQPVAHTADRLRSRLQVLSASKALKMLIPEELGMVLRPCANGRMLECMDKTGEPSLRTEETAAGTRSAWPVRIAVVNGKCHILR